ncbi:ERCC4 domain-containing protein [Favolaschia claudopus]|uniref:ERCC4 domain-containing protein n=1 Tax=Favolaschia claudopus TaxID=2862362 RepID=A0AAW0CW48_9AGAR
MALSSDIIEISDSDNDAPPLPPSSQPSFSGVVDLCLSDDDDDEDLPAPGDALFLQGLNATGKRKRHSVASSMSSATGYEDHELDLSADESPKKAPRKKQSSGTKTARKPRKTEEEKAAAKAQKQKDAADKKAMKAVDKAEKTAALAREKAAKQAYKAANKLIHDKKTTLASMEIVFPPSLGNSDLLASFRAHIAPYKMTVSVAPTNLVRRQSVFTWRRTMTAEYDPVMREWQPVQEHTQTIDTYMMYMGADELVRVISEDSEDGLKNAVRLAREGYGSPKAQMFLMVEGLKLYHRRTGGIRYTKTQLELALAGLQLAENTHLLYVDTVNEAVERLYDLSADLGIKPYKCASLSPLPPATHRTLTPPLLLQRQPTHGHLARGHVGEDARAGTPYDGERRARHCGGFSYGA